MKILFYLLLVIPSMVWSGFVMQLMWAWFVVPLGVPAIGIAHALGLRLLAEWMTYQDRDLSDKNDLLESAIKSFLIPLLMLGLGAAVHAAM